MNDALQPQTNLKAQVVIPVVKRWLDRYSPPASMRDKENAVQDEANAITRTIISYTPSTDAPGWVNSVLSRLETRMKTRAWPTVREVTDACMAQRRDDSLRNAPVMTGNGTERPPDIDSYKIAAKRMNTNQPVGEGYLFGILCVRLLEKGLVNQVTIDAYRDAAWKSRAKGSGSVDAANHWLNEQQKEHQRAIDVERASNEQRRVERMNPHIPNKRVMTPKAREFGADYQKYQRGDENEHQ